VIKGHPFGSVCLVGGYEQRKDIVWSSRKMLEPLTFNLWRVSDAELYV